MTAIESIDLQRAAKEHLWMHFTRMGGFGTADVPIIVRGDGCHLEDSNGRRYIDALAGLFSVNIGYSFGEEIGQAALEQMRELPFYTNWSYAHPRAIELAAEVASLAPGDLNRVFFCSGGSEAVESAWKLARQYYAARGEKHLRGARDARWSCGSAGGSGRARHDHRVGRVGAAALQGDRAAHRLPRNDDGGALDQRHPGHPGSVRAARLRGSARLQHEPLPPPARRDGGAVHAVPARRARAGDHRDGAGHGLPRAHGAGAERRRLLHAPGGVLARRPRDLRPLRHPALGRRGDHRLRARRLLVRVRAVRHPPGHRHEREGPLLVVRRARRGGRDGQGDGGLHGPDVHVLARHHLRRASGHVRDRAQEHRDHEARAHPRARARERGRRSARRSLSCSTCRSSAISVEPGSSGRSSS